MRRPGTAGARNASADNVPAAISKGRGRPLAPAGARMRSRPRHCEQRATRPCASVCPARFQTVRPSDPILMAPGPVRQCRHAASVREAGTARTAGAARKAPRRAARHAWTTATAGRIKATVAPRRTTECRRVTSDAPSGGASPAANAGPDCVEGDVKRPGPLRRA